MIKSKTKLKRCPFCGGIAHEAMLAVSEDWIPFIMCEDCGGSVLGTGEDNDLEDPYVRIRIEWNRRVE